MKHNKILWLSLGLVFVIVLGAGLAAGFSQQNRQETMQALEAAVHAEADLMRMSVVSLDALAQQPEQTRYTEASIRQVIQQETPPNYPQQYATGLGVRYQEKYQDKLKNLDLDALDVDSGVTDVQLLRSTKLSDTERRIRFSFVGWLTTIHHTGGLRQVRVIYNQDTLTVHMKLEDGIWKVLKTEEHQKEFAPDGYEYSKGYFRTMEEAAAFVQSMDMEAENPF